MESHFSTAFATFKNSKKCLVPGKNAYLVNLVPEKSESSSCRSCLKNNLATVTVARFGKITPFW